MSLASATSPTAFQFSGGIWGALLGFSDFAAKRLQAKRISIMYSDYGPIKDSAETARRALERAERTRERVQKELDAAAGAEQSARDEVASRATAYEEAVAAREQWSNRTR